jgi:hypothetical protein
MRKKKKFTLQSVPLWGYTVGILLFSIVLAAIIGFKDWFTAGLWIFIVLMVVLPLSFLAIVKWWPSAGGDVAADSNHHPTPAAAHAAPGHGGGHDDHGHGHGLPWSSQVIAVAVVFAFIGLFIFGLVWWADRQPKPTVVNHTPPATTSTSAPTTDPCDPLPDPATVRQFTVPVEGESEMVPVPSGYRPCYGPYKTYLKLRFKAGNGETPPSEWGDKKSENKWLGIIPGESSEPLTTNVWFVRIE